MQDQQQARRLPLGVIAGISTVIVVAGGGGAWWAWNSLQSSQVPPEPSQTEPIPTTPQSPQTKQPEVVEPSTGEKVQVFWLNDVNNQIVLAPSSVTLRAQPDDEPSKIIEGAFNSLLAGPADGSMTTTIPTGTKLRSISVEPDGVHVDLSEEFTTGGGTVSMMGRIAQVVYTASHVDPSAKVWIEVEGEPLQVLGGEGLELEQPMTRESFKKDFPL
ncbi:MAG: spore germination protein [Symploca sp. SIO2B6]|nr:spore germination protein [Symploca sp. SIO2B6]